MSTATHCDAPNCDTWTFRLTDGWLRVTHQAERIGDFCSPNCLAKWTATLTWTEEIK